MRITLVKFFGKLFSSKKELLKMSQSGITLRDLFLQVLDMNLQHPDCFLEMALNAFQIKNCTCLGVSLFYVSCFIWHYPSYTHRILLTAFRAYNNKLIKSYLGWRKRMKTYSTQAQQMRRIMINRMVSGQRMRRQGMRQMGMEINNSDSEDEGIHSV